MTVDRNAAGVEIPRPGFFPASWRPARRQASRQDRGTPMRCRRVTGRSVPPGYRHPVGSSSLLDVRDRPVFEHDLQVVIREDHLAAELDPLVGRPHYLDDLFG